MFSNATKYSSTGLTGKRIFYLTESSLSPLLLKGHTARYQNAINSRG